MEWNRRLPDTTRQGDIAALKTTQKLTKAENYTYAIDLSSPWNNKTVVLHQISKGFAPVLNQQALWLDPSGETFYAYDGGLSPSYTGGGSEPLTIWELPEPPDNALWQFSPSSTGESGGWSQILIPPASNFSTLSRTVAGAYGFGGDLGFAIGGWENGFTDGALRGDLTTYNAPDMVVYNMSSQIWYNVSTEAISYYRTAHLGTAQFVPSFGPAGLLFMLGGESTSGSSVRWPNSLPHQFFPLDSLSMYEPQSQTWLSQTTNGDIPSGVLSPCVVGIEGDEHTYEVKQARTGSYCANSSPALFTDLHLWREWKLLQHSRVHRGKGRRLRPLSPVISLDEARLLPHVWSVWTYLQRRGQ